MFITPVPDLTFDIQGWSGLQNRCSADWLSKSTHVLGIVALDRLNPSAEKCGQLLMQLWKPRNEFSCLLSKVWLGATLSSYIMVWNMLKSRLGSVLYILLITSLAIYLRPVLLVNSYIMVAVSSSSLPSSSIWECNKWRNFSHSFFLGKSMWQCPFPPQRCQIQLGLCGTIFHPEVFFWILFSRVI